MASKHCHKCEHNGKGDDACLTCNFGDTSRSRKAVSIEKRPDALAVQAEPEEEGGNAGDLEQMKEFFREFLFLRPRARDVFCALYVNQFNAAKACEQLALGKTQMNEYINYLKGHPYFAKFL